MDTILAGKLPKYDYGVDTSPEFLQQNGWFRTSRAYVKAILCLLASKHPKSFVDGSDVSISNDCLKRANSRNYHHFFPKGFLRKQGDDEWANHVVNITIVDEDMNKRLIRDKAPSVYMREFRKKNAELEATMKSHFIGLEGYGPAVPI